MFVCVFVKDSNSKTVPLGVFLREREREEMRVQGTGRGYGRFVSESQADKSFMIDVIENK